MTSLSRTALTRRSVLGASAAGGVLVDGARVRPSRARGVPRHPQAHAGRPVRRLRDERRDALGVGGPGKYLTDQARLFVRNHTSTPVIDRSTWRLRVFGDGLTTPRAESAALALSYDDLRRLPAHDPRVGPRVHGQRPQLLRVAAGHPGDRHRLEARRGRQRRLGGRPAARRAQAGGPRRPPRCRSRPPASTPATSPEASTTARCGGRSPSPRRSTTPSWPGG